MLGCWGTMKSPLTCLTSALSLRFSLTLIDTLDTLVVSFRNVPAHSFAFRRVVGWKHTQRAPTRRSHFIVLCSGEVCSNSSLLCVFVTRLIDVESWHTHFSTCNKSASTNYYLHWKNLHFCPTYYWPTWLTWQKYIVKFQMATLIFDVTQNEKSNAGVSRACSVH